MLTAAGMLEESDSNHDQHREQWLGVRLRLNRIRCDKTNSEREVTLGLGAIQNEKIVSELYACWGW